MTGEPRRRALEKAKHLARFFPVLRPDAFVRLLKKRGDMDFVKRCLAYAAELRESLETHGWDGQWYRRAYFDDGTPLGSAESKECRIDSISQSWAVLSGSARTGGNTRPGIAGTHILSGVIEAIQLLEPPFDTSHQALGISRAMFPACVKTAGNTHMPRYGGHGVRIARSHRQGLGTAQPDQPCPSRGQP